MKTVYAILVGVLWAPIGSLLATLATYGVLCLFMAENQGRRGLLAGVLGIPAGLLLGYLAGHALSSGLLHSSHGWKATALALLLAIPAGLVLGAISLIAGIHLAESRGIAHDGGQRLTWGLLHVALPVAAVVGLAAFLLGRFLAARA